jgi:hypothetical protein
MVGLRFPRLALGVALFMCAQAAIAITCPPQYYRFVGCKTPVGICTYDAMCTDDGIQQAIDQSAIDNPSCPTTIVITDERSYANQALTIDNRQSLILKGVGPNVPCGINACDPSTGCTQPVITISGGLPDKSVLTITGNSTVTLQYLEITGGNLSASHRGGGIFFGDAGSGGYGTLTLDTVTVDHNTAGYGGGISFSPSGDGTSSTLSNLTLLANTLILANTAVNDGGGIRIEGDGAEGSLFALQPQILIGYNTALNGYGGGIVVALGGYVDIGSPGYNGSPVLQYNKAQAGGGAIAAFDESHVRVFTTDAQNPVQVSNNSTAGLGGAVYLKGLHFDDPSLGYQPRACFFDYKVNDNIAVDGAAIYADIDPDNGYSVVDLNPPDSCGRGPISDEGAVACAVPCNQMYRNIAENDANQPTGGAVVGVSSSYFRVNKLDLRGSGAGELIEQALASTVTLNSCLLADNHTQRELIGASYLTIDNCTMANNTIDDGYVLYVPVDGSGNGLLKIANTIIDQPDNLPLDYQPSLSNLNASYLLLRDIASFPKISTTILAAEPTFVDAANGDYHLQATSWGIDFAPAESGVATTDLDGNPRNVDLPPVPNLYGAHDLGAYERQYVCVADTVFCNGFDQYL